MEQLIEIEITKDNLPKGFWWDEDGACFEAELWKYDKKGWRWVARNIKAFAKGIPDKKMMPYIQPKTEPHKEG